MTTWSALALAFLLLAILAALAGAAWNARQRRQRYQSAIDVFLGAAVSDRAAALEPLLADRNPHPAAWYLQGCIALRENRTRQAARAFGVAHHADYNLLTAALLTYAALKAGDRAGGDIVEQIIQTWNEMKRPGVLDAAEDRLMIDCLLSTAAAPPALSALGALVWCILNESQQARLRQALSNEEDWTCELRGLP